jgi:hypothetical protein
MTEDADVAARDAPEESADAARDHLDELVDEALRQSFPASDPPALQLDELRPRRRRTQPVRRRPAS